MSNNSDWHAVQEKKFCPTTPITKRYFPLEAFFILDCIIQGLYDVDPLPSFKQMKKKFFKKILFVIQ